MSSRHVVRVKQGGGLTCSLCKSELTEPKLLPCYHTFCLQCLQELMDKVGWKAWLNCPTCFSTVEVPVEGADSLDTNIYIKMGEVIEKLETERNSLRCQVCKNKNKEVIAHCLICNENYGSSCCFFHKSMKVSRDHKLIQVVPYREDPTAKVNESDAEKEDRAQKKSTDKNKDNDKDVDEKLKGSKQETPCNGDESDKERKKEDVKRTERTWVLNTFCQHHKYKENAVEYLCPTCDKAVCKPCLSLFHAGHDVLTISEDWQRISSELKEELDSQLAEDVVEHNTLLIKYIRIHVNACVAKTKGKIMEQKEAINMVLGTIATELIRLVEDDQNAFKTKCDNMLAGLDKFASDQSHMTATIQSLLSGVDRVKVLREKGQISDFIAYLPSCPDGFMVESYLDFNPGTTTSSRGLLQSMFGELRKQKVFIPSISLKEVATFEVPEEPAYIACVSETCAWLSQGTTMAKLFDVNGNEKDTCVLDSGSMDFLMVDVDGHLCFIEKDIQRLKQVHDGKVSEGSFITGNCYGACMSRKRCEVVIANYGRIDICNFKCRVSTVDVGYCRPMNVAVSDAGRICFSDHRTGEVGILDSSTASTVMSKQLAAQHVAFHEDLILVTDSNGSVHLQTSDGDYVKVVYQASAEAKEEEYSYSRPVTRISTYGHAVWLCRTKTIHVLNVVKTYPKYLSKWLTPQ